MKKMISAVLVFLLALQAPAANTERVELWAYNLNATVITYFVLGPDPGTAGLATVSTSGSSTTLTAASSAFADVSVGDMLIITATTGVIYRKAVHAKASNTSLTMSTAAITLAAGSTFRWRKLASGTADTNGAFSTSDFESFTVQVEITQMVVASGGVSVSLECRAHTLADWAPAYPVTVPPAAQATVTYTAAGTYTMGTYGVYNSCRVGLLLSGADDASGDAGANAEKISIFVVGARR